VDRMPGAPYNPLSAAEMEEKFLSLSTPVFGEKQSKAVVGATRALENLADVASLAALLRK